MPESAAGHQLQNGSALPCRVIAVEDDHDVAESFVELLKTSCGVTDVRAVYDAAAALFVIPQFHPTVVFIDIDLPGMDGYELARRLRSQYGTTLRLYALTGFGQQRDKDRARAAGFDMHLTKPVDLTVLRELVGAAARQ